MPQDNAEPVENEPSAEAPAGNGKVVDEDWKEEARHEKARIQEQIDRSYTEEKEAAASQQIPEPSFLLFIQNLAAQALIHLGEFENPITGRTERNLDIARHTIDTLAMLRDKTSGNLTDEEQRTLDTLLTNLRLKYVDTARSAGPAAGDA